MADLIFDGVIPANICPFKEDLSLDEEGLRDHVRWLASVDGVTAIACNGHAGEVTSLTRAERKRVTEIISSEVGDKVKVISGVVADSTAEAVEHARDAKEAGADAILLGPPSIWLMGRDIEGPEHFVRDVSKGADIPIVIFQYSVYWGTGRYPTDVLAKLCRIDNVVAVKSTSWEMRAHEKDYRTLKEEVPHISVLSANDEHLMISYILGADGTLVGFASLVPHQIVDLFRAVKGNDLKRAREVHDAIYPLCDVVYGREPKINMHPRIKEALKMLGKLECSLPRPPLRPISREERDELERALKFAGLM